MLSLTTRFGGLFAAAVFAIGLVGAAPAPAATLSWSALPATATGNPLATTTGGTVIENDATDIPKVRKSPWADIGSGIYTSVGKNSFAEYVLGGLFKQLTVVWGSPDAFNTLEFFRAGVLIDTITGAGFSNFGKNIALPTLLATAIGDGMGFDTLRFKSGSPAFEYGNLQVSAIPVPAAGLLLLTAIGGVAALRRRKSV